MLQIQTTRQFEKDLKVSQKRKKDLNKLWKVVETLAQEKELKPKHQQFPVGVKINRMNKLSL